MSGTSLPFDIPGKPAETGNDRSGVNNENTNGTAERGEQDDISAVSQLPRASHSSIIGKVRSRYVARATLLPALVDKMST